MSICYVNSAEMSKCIFTVIIIIIIFGSDLSGSELRLSPKQKRHQPDHVLLSRVKLQWEEQLRLRQQREDIPKHVRSRSILCLYVT